MLSAFCVGFIGLLGFVGLLVFPGFVGFLLVLSILNCRSFIVLLLSVLLFLPLLSLLLLFPLRVVCTGSGPFRISLGSLRFWGSFKVFGSTLPLGSLILSFVYIGSIYNSQESV